MNTNTLLLGDEQRVFANRISPDLRVYSAIVFMRKLQYGVYRDRQRIDRHLVREPNRRQLRPVHAREFLSMARRAGWSGK